MSASFREGTDCAEKRQETKAGTFRLNSALPLALVSERARGGRLAAKVAKSSREVFWMSWWKRGLVQFAGTALRVLRTNWTSPRFHGTARRERSVSIEVNCRH